MPGAINNEDYTLIDVSRGVYKTHPIAVPDGYAYNLENFIIKNGVPTQRYPIAPVDCGSYSTADGWYGLTIPPYLVEVNLPVSAGNYMLAAFKATNTGYARPVLVGIIDQVGLNNKIGKIMPASDMTAAGGMVVYNETFYVGCAAGVFKYGLANFPTSITETAIATSPPNLQKLITHKSRLFGFKGDVGGSNTNRLYFTDAPAVGGLPETWNPTVNFIDFNGPGGKTVMWDIVSLNNYIYVFTNNGIFSLYTSGAPANWIVRLINPDLSVTSMTQVVVKNNLIYFVAEDGVYITDGFDFKLISQPLQEFFSGIRPPRESARTLVPFNGGILLKAGLSVANNRGTFFFTSLETIAWSEIKLTTAPTPTDNGPDGTVSVVSIDVFDSATARGLNTLMVIYHSVPPNASPIHAFVYELQTPADDDVFLSNDRYFTMAFDAITGSITRPIQCAVETKEITGSNMMRMKLFRDYMLLVGSELPYTLVGKLWFNGKDIPTPLTPAKQDSPQTQIPGASTPVNTYSIIKLGLLTQQALSFRIRLEFSLIQVANLKAFADRYYLSILAMGYTAELERTATRTQVEGQF